MTHSEQLSPAIDLSATEHYHDTFTEAVNLQRQLLLNSRCQLQDGTPLALAAGLRQIQQIWHESQQRGGSVYLLGNGGSAAVASHIVNDLCNTAGISASTLHEPALLTCYANDYGYEMAYARLLARMAKPRDVLVAISSSGASANILQAVAAMRSLGGEVITLSGFCAANPLRKEGHLNLWVDSSDYGQVEIAHLFLLHHLCVTYRAVTGAAHE
ncbi:MAG: SIS domain-containing protein [Gammaproteobacteria bacterium]|nr:SIS domain-containing protein [Gammaproteobacteria bacterium]